MFRCTSPGHGFSVIFCNCSRNSYKILAHFFYSIRRFFMTHNIIHTPRKTGTLRKFCNRFFQRASHRTSLSETGSRSLTSELSVQRPEGASYGGSQSWFSSPSIHGYGCGLIAAHDLLWYLERKESLTEQSNHPRSEKRFTSDSCSWENYERSVKKLHRLFPILPRLGINGLMLSTGLNLAFFLRRLPYRACWHIGYRNTGKEISHLLRQNIPVILSIGGNFPLIWKKDRLPLYKKTGDGVYIKFSSTRAHYVTVTGIEHGWLRISSWGQEWYINWREYRNFAWRKSCPLFSNICYITRKQ